MRSEMLRPLSACNQKCIFCNGPQGIGTVPVDRVKQEIDHFASAGVKEIIFSGGEPTLRKDLFELITYCRSQGMQKVNLYTNAILCTKKYCSGLIEAGLTDAFVSLHSHIEEVSDFLTQSPGTFRKTLKGIASLGAAGLDMTINIVINSANFTHLPEYTEFLFSKFKFPFAISFSFVMSGGGALQNPRIVPRMTDVVPYLLKSYSYAAEKGAVFSNPECGLPICFVPQYAHASAYFQQVESGAITLEHEIEKNTQEKIKLEICSECKFNDHCLGIWRGYIAIHGAEEIKPVKDN